MFTLSDEHRMLADAAERFIQERMPVAHLRAIRDAGGRDGFDRARWAEMAAMGWTGLLIPEDHGGSALGYLGLGLILEQAGRTLAPSPLLSTALIGASGLTLGEPDDLKHSWLPRIAAGEAVTALAVDETGHHAPDAAAAIVSGRALTGRKTFVADGHTANALLVSAVEDGVLGLYLVEAERPEVRVSPLTTVDSRGAADIAFEAAPARKLGGAELIEQVLDRARIGAAAEMLGSAGAAFETTAEYLKTRTQFGQTIGAFQGLQHRAARLFVELELTRSCVRAALALLDEGAPDRKIAEYASLAKARAGDTLHLATNEMVQMHGGIGMTDAHDAGLYLKRARVCEALYGSAGFHRDRYASLAGL